MTEPLKVQRFWIPTTFRYTRLSEESVEVVLVSDYDALCAENERLKGEIDTLDSLLKDRTAQLAAAQARCAQLDKALNRILTECDDPLNQSNISNAAFIQALQALTPAASDEKVDT